MIRHRGSQTQIDHARKAGLNTRELYPALHGTRPEPTYPGVQPIDSNGYIARITQDGSICYQSYQIPAQN